MAPKSLAQQLAELEDPTPRDFDPEDLDRGVQSSDEEGGKAVDANAGREHYQAVGKGKLRKQDPVALGKQYAGSKVSRQALEAESDDDPFAARSSDEEDEEDDDEELGSDEDEDEEDISDDEEEEEEEESEEETARPAKSAAKKAKKEVSFDDMDTDGSDEMDGFEDDDDEEEEDFPSDEDDEDEDDDSDASDAEPRRTGKTDDREELRKLMASDQKTIAATISQAAKADAAKGKAVKQQRATFDALLNTRIKLQKGLTAINQLSLAAAQQHSSTTDEKSPPDAEAEADATPEPLDGEAIKSAESAALALWSTLEDLRLALADAHHKQQQGGDDSKKRKRPAPVTPATSSASLWKRMTALEAESLAHRRAVLDKWSQKVRGATAATTANARGKLLSASTASQTISTVLDAQVATETAAGLRAVKRARTAAPTITTTSTKGTKSTTTDKAAAEQPDEPAEPLYDDTVFYQTLLRELVEQRMSSSDAITNGLDTLHLQLPSRLSAVHPVTGMRKDKVKRDVDTRASKGRKMKFEIHEKLQNFMAPEDRGAWTRHAREEFFASLLGNTASGMLREEDEDEGVDAAAGEDSDVDREEGGLRLFRN